MNNNPEQKRNVGRPKSDDRVALDAIMKNEKTRDQFKEVVDNLVSSKMCLMMKQETHTSDVAGAAETFKLSKGWLNTLVNGLANDKIQEVAEKGSLIAEVVEELFGEGE
jgi:hypothetical protein